MREERRRLSKRGGEGLPRGRLSRRSCPPAALPRAPRPHVFPELPPPTSRTPSSRVDSWPATRRSHLRSLWEQDCETARQVTAGARASDRNRPSRSRRQSAVCELPTQRHGAPSPPARSRDSAGDAQAAGSTETNSLWGGGREIPPPPPHHGAPHLKPPPSLSPEARAKPRMRSRVPLARTLPKCIN